MFRRLAPKIDPTRTAVRRKPSLDFSMTGLVYICMMIFMGLAAMNTKASLLFGVFGLMLGVILVSWLLSRFVLRKLRVRRVLPEHAVVGQATPVSYEFTNDKNYLPSLSVSLAEIDGVEAFVKQPFAYLLHAAPRATATVPGEITPKRRGVHALDKFQLSTSFPFGFIKRAVFRQTRDTLIVHPPLAEVDSKLLMLCRSSDKSGASMRPKRGGMDEFYGVKEYRDGENPRWIYWRRSARTGVLVAKEMTQVAPPRLMLLVDTFIAQRTPEAHERVERAIAMAASLATHALAQGLMVGLYAWADGWASIPPNRGKRHSRDILSQLSRLPLNQSHDGQELLAASRPTLPDNVTPVLLTPRDVEQSLAERSRGSLLTIAAKGTRAAAWFRFDPRVDFRCCMPIEQQPVMDTDGDGGSA